MLGGKLTARAVLLRYSASSGMLCIHILALLVTFSLRCTFFLFWSVLLALFILSLPFFSSLSFPPPPFLWYYFNGFYITSVNWSLNQDLHTLHCCFFFLFLLQTLGSIPWQSYFQRVLSVSSVNDARRLSVLAGVSALILALPPICLGVVGSSVGLFVE